MSFSDDDLRATAAELLGTRAMPIDALAAAVNERAGLDLSVLRVEEVLLAGWSFVEVADGLAHVPSLLAATTWTTEPDPASTAAGVVRLYPDLAPLARLLADVGALPLSDAAASADGDGAEPLATVRWAIRELDGVDTDVLTGPPGWLDEIGDGPVSVSVTDEGLRIAPCPTRPTPTDAQVAAVRAAFDAAAEQVEVDMGRTEPVELRHAPVDDLAAEALVVDRDAFLGAAVAPLTDLLAATGLEERDGVVGPVGIEWDALRSWRLRQGYIADHGLDEEQAKTLFAVLAVATMFLADEADPALGTDEEERAGIALLVGLALGHGPTADAFWAETVERGMDPVRLGRFADAVVAAYTSEPRTPVGLAWLRARCLDAAGDVATAVAVLEEAARDETEHVPALVDLAGFAADRSDASGALRLLQRTGVTDHDHHHHDDHDHDGHGHDHDHHGHHHGHGDEQASMADAHDLLDEVGWLAERRPPAMAGRNDRCPCGSGRKYKVCHLGRELHPLDDRASWLAAKAERFLLRWHADFVEDLAATIADPLQAPLAHAELHGSPFVADLALHEGGLFADFLASRAALLPSDERALGERWLEVPRALFELERVNADTILLRDLLTDEHVALPNLGGMSASIEGHALVGRPVPVGDGYRAFSGFFPVEAAQVPLVRAAIDDGDPEVLAMALGQTLSPADQADAP